ncbi:hypothetical protein [Paenibacillus pini]|uniref:DUF4177 domain-containing protein n=1 Tax=Paenibacillus pini JCM 16418 TaxID=1236976 RepID=W7YIT7_9BACL|nr:hypothetical protein [Paenibacillus pini]GAF10810.1 hypothetical protein JCM16418_5032 [Paenibacillus pini JCM 16418]
MQKAVVVTWYNEKKNNLEDLNNLLKEGWKVVSQSSMSGAGGRNDVVSLVILEK